MVAKRQAQAIIYALSAVFLWSTVATAFKITLAYLLPIQLLCIAIVTSIVLLSLQLSYKKLWGKCFLAFRTKPFYYLAMGVVNPVIYYLLLFKAYALLPAQQAQTLNYTWAVSLSLLSALILRQKFTLTDFLCCIICYAGAFIIATGGRIFSLDFNSSNGVLLALSSTFVWALYWVLSVSNKEEPSIALWLCFACALPLIMIINFFSGSWNLSYQGILGAIYIGSFEMGVTFVLWLIALKKAERVSQISNFIFLSPFLSLVFIYFILNESIQPTTLLGLILIVLGILIQQKQKNKVG